MPRLLVIDDDAAICELVDAYARTAGWAVETVRDATHGLRRYHAMRPDIVVLDLMLPDASGWSILEAIRDAGDTYVIVLSARCAEADRIHGLTRGADDYMTKPFSPGELIARCQALLRRPRGGSAGQQPQEKRIEIAGLTLDVESYAAHLDGIQIALSVLEFQLLCTLARHPGRVFTRGQLADIVWGSADVGDGRVIDVHLGRLRKKLGEGADKPRFIETVRGVGYRLRAAGAPP